MRRRILKFIMSRDGVYSGLLGLIGAWLFSNEFLTPAYVVIAEGVNTYCERVSPELREQWRLRWLEIIAPHSISIYCADLE